MNNKQMYKDDIEQKSRSTKKKVLTGLGSVAGAAGAVGLNTFAGNKFDELAGQNITTDNARSIVNNFNKKYNRNVKFNPVNSLGESRAMAPFKTNNFLRSIADQGLEMNPTDKKRIDTLNVLKNGRNHITVNSYNNDSVLLHELGHAKNMGKKGTDLLALNKVTSGASLPLISKNVRKRIRKLSNGNSNGLANKSVDFIEKHPELLMYAARAPKLIEEGRASAYATRELMKAYGTKNGLKKSIPLAAAYGTYLTAAAVPSLLAGGYIRNTKTREE